jgi:hypothetical protein
MKYFVFEADHVATFNEPEGMDAGAAQALVTELLKDEDYSVEDIVVLKAQVVKVDVERRVTFQ